MAGAGTGNGLRGDLTAMGYENSTCAAPADPYGVALDLTSFTDAKICAQITPAFEADELEFDTVGCGGTSGFGTDCAIQNFQYRLSLSGDVGFQNGYDKILAQFFGTTSAPVEQTVGAGDYLHVFSFGASINGHFGTFAYESSQTDVIEAVSTFTESITISMPGVGEPIRYTAVLVASDVEFDVASAVNDNADLQSLSFVVSERIVPECAHEFRIKEMLDDGTDVALASPADVVAILSYELEMETPLAVVNEMTGGDCNAPTQDGERTATLTVTFKEHQDNLNLSFQNWKEGDFYQADITWTGSIINNPLAGVNLSHTLRTPKLCLVDAPTYNVTDPAINGYTLVFRVLDSENLIPGFTTNAPEAVFINQRPDIYLDV